MSEPAIIHAHIYDPSQSIFKTSKNERAECQTISCINNECPLRKKYQCHMNGGLFGNSCPYGRKSREKGLTRRAAGYRKWVADKKELYKDVPYLSTPETKMQFIGEYVLLPYSHMTMCKEVPFLSHSAFILLSEWTIENVVKLIGFRPQALFGGEIRTYQSEEIPKFLLHLREADTEMWAKVIEFLPQLDKTPNHIGRSAVLSTLTFPIEWDESVKDHGGKYAVHWKWDGEKLTTNSMSSFSETWGRVKVDSVEIHAIPKKRATVVVQSNEWVNENTEFTD